MRSLTIKSLFIAAASASLLAALPSQAAELGPQRSQDAGVGIQVTPLEVAATASEWTFSVELNTHSQNLGDDLAAEAVLVDAAGKPQPAIGWEGDAPGGHHRKGVLRFAPLSPTPPTIEVRIQRAAEAQPRTFQWSTQ
ncbi:MAG TPA: hypothetical protein VF814_11765 [Casimicrobiaceae bacterium]